MGLGRKRRFAVLACLSCVAAAGSRNPYEACGALATMMRMFGFNNNCLTNNEAVNAMREAKAKAEQAEQEAIVARQEAIVARQALAGVIESIASPNEQSLLPRQVNNTRTNSVLHEGFANVHVDIAEVMDAAHKKQEEWACKVESLTSLVEDARKKWQLAIEEAKTANETAAAAAAKEAALETKLSTAEAGLVTLKEELTAAEAAILEAQTANTAASVEAKSAEASSEGWFVIAAGFVVALAVVMTIKGLQAQLEAATAATATAAATAAQASAETAKATARIKELEGQLNTAQAEAAAAKEQLAAAQADAEAATAQTATANGHNANSYDQRSIANSTIFGLGEGGRLSNLEEEEVVLSDLEGEEDCII